MRPTWFNFLSCSSTGKLSFVPVHVCLICSVISYLMTSEDIFISENAMRMTLVCDGFLLNILFDEESHYGHV
jgi:hypothetical protein